MVGWKYAAAGRRSAGRLSVLPGWVVPLIAGAVVLSLFDQLFALYRLFFPDPSQSSGSAIALPLPVRVFQWAVWGVNQSASVTTVVPTALLAWFASSRASWTPRVSRGAKTVALVATLVFAVLTALRPVVALLWLAFGDSTQMTYGLATDDFVSFVVGSGVIANTWTALVAAVVAWVLHAARPADSVPAGSVPVGSVPVGSVPVGAAADAMAEASVADTEANPPAQGALSSMERERAPEPAMQRPTEVLDIAAFRRPPHRTDPEHQENGDSDTLFRRPS
jgi:hypothetical protein